jgi:protein-tyrosine-phosphatase
MQEAYPNESRSVPDPYYNDNGFEEVFAMLELACDNIIEHYA